MTSNDNLMLYAKLAGFRLIVLATASAATAISTGNFMIG